jgi:hypothetical protein
MLARTKTNIRQLFQNNPTNFIYIKELAFFVRESEIKAVQRVVETIEKSEIQLRNFCEFFIW